MPTHHPENEKIKRRYFDYLSQARGKSEASIDQAAAAIHRFEQHSRYRSFKKFHIKQAVSYKEHLLKTKNIKTGKPLSGATVYGRLRHLRDFFRWLAGQSGYRSRINFSDADYFNLTDKEARVAKVSEEKQFPSIDQIQHVLSVMPSDTDIEQRNRALIAFTLLTGARDGALASLKMKHVNLDDGSLFQDAREVRTKFSKSFSTWFFPVGEEVLEIVQSWIAFLRKEKNFRPADPLFPASRVARGEDGHFAVSGIDRMHWSDAGPIRKIFREAFEQAGLPYFSPHTFRNTLAQLGEQICTTPEEFKAWSQNLGHEKVMTTFSSYGSVPQERQGKIIRRIGKRSTGTSDDDLAGQLRAMAEKVERGDP